jgi:hypothetical protein
MATTSTAQFRGADARRGTKRQLQWRVGELWRQCVRTDRSAAKSEAILDGGDALLVRVFHNSPSE